MDGDTKKRARLGGAKGEFSVKQEVDILCAVEALQPHLLPGESAQIRWQEVAERVKQRGEGDVDGDACQRYYVEVMASMRSGQQEKRPRSKPPVLTVATLDGTPVSSMTPPSASVASTSSRPAKELTKSQGVSQHAAQTPAASSSVVHGPMAKRRRGRPPKSSAPQDPPIEEVEQVKTTRSGAVAKELADLQARAEWLKYEEARKRVIEKGRPPPPTPAEKKRMTTARLKRLENEKAEREEAERKTQTAAERQARKQARETTNQTAVAVGQSKLAQEETGVPESQGTDEIPAVNPDGDEDLEGFAALNDLDQSVSPSSSSRQSDPKERHDETQPPKSHGIPPSTTTPRLTASVCTTQLEDEQSIPAVAIPARREAASTPPAMPEPIRPAPAIPEMAVAIERCDNDSQAPPTRQQSASTTNNTETMKQTITMLMDALESSRRGYVEFKRTVAGIRDREKEHLKRIDNLSMQINKTETERSKYQNDLCLLRADFERYRANSTNLPAEAVQEKAGVALLTTSLERIQNELTAHKQSFEEYKSRESRRHEAFAQANILTLRDEIEKLKAAAAVDKRNLEARLTALETERLAFRAALEKDARKRDELITAVAKKLEDYQTYHDDQLAVMDINITALGDALLLFESKSTKRDERSRLLELERDAQAKLEVRGLREALQNERSERTREYTSLLHSINQILKGDDSDGDG